MTQDTGTPQRTSEQSVHEQYFGHEHLTIIEPIQGWRLVNFRELWAYRELLIVLIARDLKVRYKQTVLGAAWAIIQPFMAMVVFSVFFGQLAGMPSDGYPYPIFVYSAVLPWTFFANAVSSTSSSLIGSSGLVSKVYFPRLIIPLSAVGAGVVDFAIASVILLIMMVFYGIGWSLNLFAVPLLLMAIIFTALGIGTCFAALTVAYRDFRYVVPYLTQLWMFVTPVVYPVSLVPEKWRWLLYLNPMAGLVEGFRSVFLAKPFDFLGLSISFSIALAMLLIGIAYFAQVERRFADII